MDDKLFSSLHQQLCFYRVSGSIIVRNVALSPCEMSNDFTTVTEKLSG